MVSSIDVGSFFSMRIDAYMATNVKLHATKVLDIDLQE